MATFNLFKKCELLRTSRLCIAADVERRVRVHRDCDKFGGSGEKKFLKRLVWQYRTGSLPDLQRHAEYRVF